MTVIDHNRTREKYRDALKTVLSREEIPDLQLCIMLTISELIGKS
jgi:hypothetical protein